MSDAVQLSDVSRGLARAISTVLVELRVRPETAGVEEYGMRATVLRNAAKQAWDLNKAELDQVERDLLTPVMDALEEYQLVAFRATEHARSEISRTGPQEQQ